MDCTLRFSLMLAAAIVLAVSSSFGQGRSKQWGTPASSAIHNHFEPSRESDYFNENPLEQIPVDDSQSFLLDTKGTFVYLGSFKQTNITGNISLRGWGRQKSVSNSVPTDAEIEELEQRIKRFELLFGLIGH